MNHSVNVITFDLAQSDPIKRRALYLNDTICSTIGVDFTNVFWARFHAFFHPKVFFLVTFCFARKKHVRKTLVKSTLGETLMAKWLRNIARDHGCHLAFLKWFARNKTIWPFLAFLMLKYISYFKTYFGEIWAKLAMFYEISTLKLVILTNF